MKIGGIQENYTGMQENLNGVPGKQNSDMETKTLQKEIANAEKKLQDLSYNQEMSMDEKAQKRKEIQKEISDLNRELRQHEIEKRKEQQEEKKKKLENLFDMENGTKTDSGQKVTEDGKERKGMSAKRMKAMISAEGAMTQADVKMEVANSIGHRADVLKMEIQQDKARGADVEIKQKELKKLENIEIDAKVAQIGILHGANQEMGKTAKEEYQENQNGKEQNGKMQQQAEAEQKKIRIVF